MLPKQKSWNVNFNSIQDYFSYHLKDLLAITFAFLQWSRSASVLWFSFPNILVFRCPVGTLESEMNLTRAFLAMMVVPEL